jgi:biopolymer transport protein ExbD
MRPQQANKENEGPNLTPVIDVVFLLLIFFLVATRLKQEELSADINVPEIMSPQPLVEGLQPLIVNIDKDGKYIISGTELDEASLAARIHHEYVANQHRRVQIRADQDVKFRYPLTVVGICASEGVEYSCTVLPKDS